MKYCEVNKALENMQLSESPLKPQTTGYTLAVPVFRILSKVLFSYMHKKMVNHDKTKNLLLLCFLVLLLVSTCIS